MNALKISALMLFLAPVAFAQDVVTVEATGEAAIVKGDEAKALDEATKAALRAAVEQVAGVSIEGQTQTLNNVLVRDQVIAKTSGYVRKHEVVSKKSEKGVLSVKVKADVGKSDISKDVEAARALVKRFGRPSILILIQEQTALVDKNGGVGAATSTDHTANILTRVFKDDGWDIKDPNFKEAKLKITGVAINSTDVKEMGELSKADYILYGRTVLRDQTPGSIGFDPKGNQIMFPVTGEYDLTLFATGNGAQLAKLSGALNYAKKGENELAVAKMMTTSYERTARNLIERQKDEISTAIRAGALEYFRNQEMNGAELLVSATGLGNYAGAQDFKKALQTMPGVKEVEQQEFKAGVGNYRVTFMGKSSDLADAIGKATFKKKKLEVSEVTSSKVVVAVAK